MQWLVDSDLGAQHLMAYRLALEPDAALSHVHIGAEEVLYVLDGAGEVRVEGANHQVGAGRAVFIPDGAEHTYVNMGATPLVVVGAMAPTIEIDDIHPAMPRLDLTGLGSAALDEHGVAPTMMDERQVTPTLMGERSFRVLVSPEVGCRQMTQFTGVIPTGRAPLHAHPHEEAVYILAGFAGIVAMGVMLFQPLLIGGYLPGLSARIGRRAHRWRDRRSRRANCG